MIYRLGLIGMEGHTNYALEPIPQLQNVKLTAVACANERQQNQLRKNPAFTSATKFYADFREMLEKESLDIACVYTPNNRHAESVIAAAQAGAHIFSEKPLAVTLADLETVKAAVKKAKVQLTMMLNMRSEGRYQKVRELVHSGVIGQVAQCSAQKSYKVGERNEWEKKRETLGGTIPYIACHALDLIRWCSGLEFVMGAAFHNNVGRPDMGEMENTAGIICLASNGATITTRLDYCRPEIAPSWGDDRLRFAGSEGVVEVLFGQISLITSKEKPTTIPPAKSIEQLANLVNAIEGKEPMLVPAEDCYRITEVVLKLRDAADRKVVVPL